MQKVLSSLNEHLLRLKNKTADSPIAIRRYCIDDLLMNDEISFNNLLPDNLTKLLAQRKELSDKRNKLYKKTQYEEALPFVNEIKLIDHKLNQHIELGIFKSGNPLALTKTNEMVYTSSYVLKGLFQIYF